ncbi:hypothetical protein XENOCAPTIV_029377 [Xenoophorus captivus]|uniref:G-protein coupled receptors family 1 profile domain-containing protein n=1 Tax=Xenoophorus captivus TaxID=1517983 RepID=A0ABV0RE57_9TELE
MTGNSNRTQLDNATLSLFQNVNTSTVISVIYMVITVINLVGNGLSIWLLLFRTSPKTPTIIFMINLTLTDLALGSALPFQISYQFQGYHWNLGPKMCSFLTLVFYTNMYCSILTMMAIGIDRYLGIVKPMTFRKNKRRKSVAVISCVLMWGVVLGVLYPLMTTDLTFDIPELGITTCFDVLKKSMLPSVAAWAAFLFTMVFLLFLLPFCVTMFCYVSVIYKLSSDSKTAQKGRAIRLADVYWNHSYLACLSIIFHGIRHHVRAVFRVILASFSFQCFLASAGQLNSKTTMVLNPVISKLSGKLVVLASSSPRRLEILRNTVCAFMYTR